VTEPLGRVTTSTFDANNNTLTITDPNGHTTTLAYDLKDRPASVTDPLGKATSTTYDALDRRLTVTDSRGNVTRFEYDAVGNLTATLNALNQRTESTYDANGNRLTTKDALNDVTTFTYDASNRLLTVKDALNNVTTNAYDALGHLTSVTDAEGRVTQFAYDALGRLTQVTDAASQPTKYTYDAVGNRLTITDARGNTTTSTYDDRNRLASVTDALNRQARLAYDAAGNLLSTTNARGQTTTRAYDALNRVTTITYPGGPTVSFTYDLVGNRLSMTDGIGSSTFTYDALNRLLTVTDPFGKTVGSAYDAAGNRSALTYPDGKVVQYAYDVLNRLQSVTDWLSGTTAYAYDAVGGLTGLTFPNGTTQSITYDAARRLTGLAHSTTAAPFASYAYTLDKVGNRRQATVTEPLEPPVSPTTLGYTYDSVDQLLSAGPTSYAYDADGNLNTRSQGGTTTFTFDARNLLTGATDATGTSSYRYDGLDHRREVTHNGTTTRYVLDLVGPMATVLAETDAGGAITRYYVHGHQLLSQITPGGTRLVYHPDPLGSVIALTDANKAITDAYAYDPFGTTVAQTGSTPNPFQYVGALGVMADRHGLLFMRARYYDAVAGRFLSVDPVPGSDADPQTFQRYVYALNNPTLVTDPSGLVGMSDQAAPRYSFLDPVVSEDFIAKELQRIKGRNEELRSLTKDQWMFERTKAIYEELIRSDPNIISLETGPTAVRSSALAPYKLMLWKRAEELARKQGGPIEPIESKPPPRSRSFDWTQVTKVLVDILGIASEGICLWYGINCESIPPLPGVPILPQGFKGQPL
jgi:RHS repeat-associated protein